MGLININMHHGVLLILTYSSLSGRKIIHNTIFFTRIFRSKVLAAGALFWYVQNTSDTTLVAHTNRLVHW